MLQLKNISKSFGGVHAVNNCSFSVQEKMITALIGPNGAGKTTVFNIINGFLREDSGILTFRNVDISKFPAWKRSRLGLSRTFQLSRLFKNLSVRENLLLAAREEDDLFWKNVFPLSFWNFLRSKKYPESKNYAAGSRISPFGAVRDDIGVKIEAAAEFVGLKKDLDAPVTEISYGEQKLFDLTRAMVNPHSILLLDEPVSGVNPVIREKLKELIKKLKEKGETVLLIEHDMDFVRGVADWLIVMSEGRVLREGEPDAVLKDKKVLEAYLGTASQNS